MRLVAFMLLVCCLHVSAGSISQTITFSGKEVYLQKVFAEIEKQTGYLVVCNNKLIKNAPLVTLSVHNAPVDEVMRDVLKNLQLDYFVENETIVIRRKITAATEAFTPAATADYFQEPDKLISGTVSDSTGKPLHGVTVHVKGRAGGVSTDQSGRFSIRAGSSDLLEFTYIGYQPRTLKAGNSTSLMVLLKPNVVEMEAVAVVANGYQSRSKTVVVGAVSTATARDFETAGVTTFDKALAGKMPGVYIRSESGQPGKTGQIIIRGVNTLTGNVEPLYVLDGMPLQPGEANGGMNSLLTNGIGNIPPENIETITILKDATAASIYGSRAANGVIVITTKNGKTGSDYVNYSGKYGVVMMPENKFNFMNSAQKLEFERVLYNDFHQPYEQSGRVGQLMNLVENGSMSKAEADRQIALLSQTNTDWMKELYHRAGTQSHNISFSGGNNKTTYFTSINFQNTDGSLKQNNFKLGGINMKLSRFVTSKLLVKFNMYATYKQNKEGGGTGTTVGGIDPFKYAVFANPYEKPYNDDGSYATDMTYRAIPFTVGSSSSLLYTNFNILRELRENTLTNVYGDVRGQASVEYDFLKNFKYTGSVAIAYNSIHNKDESYGGTYRSWANNWLNSSSVAGSVLPEHNRGFLNESTSRRLDYTVRNTIEYNKYFSRKHFVQAFFANEFGAVRTDQFNHFNPIYLEQYMIAGYPSWDLIPDYRALNLNLSRFGGTATRENRSASFIGSLAYAYDNRYVFNGNIRYDGVDIIGSENQFSPLWSAGVKWNAHNEAFLRENESLISRLVISAGYGYRGSINRSALPFHTYTQGTAVYNNIPLASAFAYGNPVIRWEKKQEANLGVELSLFKGRVNTDFRYFREKVIDLLDNTSTPPSVGRSSAIVNIGSLQNRGFEVTARVEVLKTRDLLWEVGGNITKVNNKLVNVYDKENPNVVSNNLTRNIEGLPVNSWFGYRFSHVNPETGSVMVYARKKTSKLVDSKVETSYEDQLVDLSQTTTAVMQTDYSTYFLGQRDPSFYGGFNTRFMYKSFELAANFVLASGNQILSFRDRREGPSGATDDITASRTNRLVKNMYRWRQAGDITDVPRYRNSASSYTAYMISTDVESGAYLKCNQMALTWRAPRSFMRSGVLKTLRAALIAENVFTLSKYSGTDAETQTPFGYPNTRTYTLSLTVGL